MKRSSPGFVGIGRNELIDILRKILRNVVNLKLKRSIKYQWIVFVGFG